jgi:hypothetical protein
VGSRFALPRRQRIERRRHHRGSSIAEAEMGDFLMLARRAKAGAGSGFIQQRNVDTL